MDQLHKYQDYITSYDTDGWRWYGTKTAPYLYPSVTTIIDEVYNNIPLNEWKAKNTLNACEKRRVETSKIGEEIHHDFEAIIKQGRTKYEDYTTHHDHVKPFIEYLDKDQIKPIATEILVISERYGYAGRLDCFGEAKGKVRVLDWKTGSNWGDSWGPQVAAYQIAVSEMLGVPDTGPNAVGFGIYHSPRDNPVIAKAMYFRHLDWVQASWLRMLDTFKDQPRFTKLNKMKWPYLMQKAMVRA